VQIDGSAADPLRIGAWSGEMDGQLVAWANAYPSSWCEVSKPNFS
jgi:hypothetical protein